LPITTELVYQRLKKRGGLMVPGVYYFPGLDNPWPHPPQGSPSPHRPDVLKMKTGFKIMERVWLSRCCV
ncbi:valine--pyruvate transaminase, partial [Enterobacter hormaechei]